MVFRPHETVTPVEDPVVREVNYVLREWSIIWKRLYTVSFFSSQKHQRCSPRKNSD